MRPEDWEKIERLFNEAAVLPRAEQSTFVKQKAGSAFDVCDNVLRLLAQDSSENFFLDQPVFTLGARLLTDDEGEALIKKGSFAHYRLLQLIGRGGMGIVYLAQDTRLDRRIALKLLPESFDRHSEMITRFRQEARAASNVAHQSVAHIYDFGEFEKRFYLAMEYVPGPTLRELIKEQTVDQTKAFDIASQIASALQAAHKSGIVHRDIKPENIVIPGDGLVKILDFGLAKLTPNENTDSYETSLETAPGLIMGTTAYMSPEQVRGEEVDATTDIWSLSVVLYEMLTGGKRPFTGKTSSDIRAAILRDEPLLAVFSPPAKALFEKSLHKEKENRFQTAENFRQALEELKTSSDGIFASTLDSSKIGKRRINLLSPSKFSAKAVFSLIAVLILVTLAFYFFRQTGNQPTVQNQKAQYKITRLTGSGSANYAAISPDGKSIVYSLEPRLGEEGLFVRSIESGEETVLIPPAALEFSGVAFSTDGQYIYYAVKPADGIIASLYRIPSGGGAAQKVLEDIDSAPGFSPDGKRFAYLKIDPDGKFEDIYIADTDGGSAQMFYRRAMPDFIPHQVQPSWSPDGEKIILAAGANENGVKTNEVIAVRVSNRQGEKVKSPVFAQISKTVWFKNENAFLITARKEEAEDARQIWRLAYPSGETNQITNDLFDYSGISVDDAGEKILTLAGENAADLWVTDLEINADQQVTSGGNDSKGVTYTPDGRTVYSSNSSGRLQIWIADQDGSNKKQLTFDEFSNTEPAVSPDGKQIAYVSTRTGSRNIWLMDINGQNGRKLTGGSQESTPVFTKDGKSLLFFNFNSGINALSRISLENGQIDVLFEGARRYPTISPDGKLLLSSYRPPGATGNKIIVVPLDTSSAAEPRIFEPLPGASSPGVLRWLPDGKAFAYIVTKTGASNLYKQSVDGSEPVKFTNFTKERIYWFDFSPDGKSVVTSRGNQRRFVTLLQKINS